jgi:methyltransferase-like protein/cyclopropane fatty-acyl-phospholipid synthase-like methyltransferase
VLEIGCAAGGNLIPLALQFPDMKILGMDLSAEQIAQAHLLKKEMGLKNIEFAQGDIATFKGLKEYDYIICHGVFSWVPDFVRDKILDICRDHLSENGLAVISFNTLPGWSAVKSLREMMLFHANGFVTPAQKIHEAKSLLNFLYENTPTSNEAYRQIIDRERTILKTTNDSYVFHEHLESENHQYYLHQFVEMAGKHGMGYVGDAEIASMYIGNFNPAVQETLGKIKDVVRQEQYIDFITNRRFRHAILTKLDNVKKINRSVKSENIGTFHLQARFKFDTEESAGSGKYKFINPDTKATFDTADVTAGEVFKAMAEANRPVTIDEIAATLKKSHNIDPEAVRQVLMKNGFLLALQNFISLHVTTVDFAREPGPKPKAYKWARYIAKTHKTAKVVTNLKRETVGVVPFTRTLLQHLDGNNTHADLLKLMTQHVLDGDLKVNKKDQPVTDKAEIETILKQEIEPALKKLASMALLEA